MDELKYSYNSEIICPHCDYTYYDSWELEDDGEMNCESCGKEFYVEKDITVTYSTSKT